MQWPAADASAPAADTYVRGVADVEARLDSHGLSAEPFDDGFVPSTCERGGSARIVRLAPPASLPVR